MPAARASCGRRNRTGSPSTPISGTGRGVLARIGFDRARPLRDLALGAALAAVIGVPGLGLYLLGRFKLSHDSDLTHLSVGRLLMAVLAFSFMTYLIPGLFGAPLPLLAGYLPPQSNRDFSIASADGGAPAVAATGRPAQCEAPRYAEFLELPHGLNGYFDLEQAKRCAKRAPRRIEAMQPVGAPQDNRDSQPG